MKVLLWMALGSNLAFPCFADDLELSVIRIHDENLQIELFAREPEIVTPIGAVCDDRGRLFVIESHTHRPNKDYPGPQSDRVKIFQDADGDGRADRISVYADGFQDAMNVAFSPEGDLFVCHRTGVTRLHHSDRNEVSGARTEVLRTETKAKSNPHSGLLGIVFSHDGWMYVSRGNLGGAAYVIHGSDGSTVSGYGDGGNVVRCRPDGSGLEEVATGFWNPFAMEFDGRERLLLVDNDPDSRGPNRLVHVIPGGDYGFQAIYGPSGLHPFNAWNGELPGTLPMIAGTGEAPSGVLDATRAALPDDYRDNVLVTIWREHTIERFRLEPQGTSLRSHREVWVSGGSDFRPVGITAAPDGSIYVTDWVKRDYPNHGLGRIWKISAKRDVAVLSPRGRAAPSPPDEGTQRLLRLQHADTSERIDELLAAAVAEDPFVRSAAITALARPEFETPVREALHDPNPEIRLSALLALRRAGERQTDEELRRLLGDESIAVRKSSLIAASEAGRRSLEDDLETAITTVPVSADLLEAYLAARQSLSPHVQRQLAKEAPGFHIQRVPDAQLVDELVLDPDRPAALTALAVQLVRGPDRPAMHQRLATLARSDNPRLQREAVRTLAEGTDPDTLATLRAIAVDHRQPAQLRADAVQGLAGKQRDETSLLLSLLSDSALPVQIEAVRALRPYAAQSAVQQAFQQTLASVSNSGSGKDLHEQIEFALAVGGVGERGSSQKPPDLEATLANVEEGGDVDAGQRVFFDSRLKCAGCHRCGGRGEGIGPDLSVIGRSANRRSLLRSLLSPSDDIAPGFQVHTLVTRDGQVFSGIQFHFRGQAASIITGDGKEKRFRLADLESYHGSTKSLMPDGLGHQIPAGDLRSLLAFLESCK